MASSSIGKATPVSKRAALLSSGTSSGVEDKRAKLAMINGEQHLLQLRLLQAQLCKNLHYLTGMADQDPLPGSWTLSQLASHQRSRGSIELRPLYAEAVLKDRRRAQMLLRLALGVSDDGQGGKQPFPLKFNAFTNSFVFY